VGKKTVLLRVEVERGETQKKKKKKEYLKTKTYNIPK